MSVKANEGVLYALERFLSFYPNQLCSFITLILVWLYSHVLVVVQLVVLLISWSIMRDGTEHAFSNISKEEFDSLEEHFRKQDIDYKNELAEETTAINNGRYEEEDESEDEELCRRGRWRCQQWVVRKNLQPMSLMMILARLSNSNKNPIDDLKFLPFPSNRLSKGYLCSVFFG